MELMTSRAFLAQVEGLSPVAVMRLAARAGSTKSRDSILACLARESVLPAGAGVRHGGQGEPGTGKCEPDETPSPCSS